MNSSRRIQRTQNKSTVKKGTVRRWLGIGIMVTTLGVATPSLALAAGNAKVGAYVMKDPIAGAVALPTSTLQPYLTKIVAGLKPFVSTYGVASVAMKGWISRTNGIEDIIEIGAFPHPLVSPTLQSRAEVLVSCQSATKVTPKKTTALKAIPNSTEAQCVNKKGVRLLTSIGWADGNVLVLDLVTGTTKSEAEKWALEQFHHVPVAGIVLGRPTPLSTQYAADTRPLYNAMNRWLVIFQAWANANGTASQAALFDHPYVVALNAAAATIAADKWSSATQPKIDAAVKAINTLSTHINDLAFVTEATAPAWGKKYALDQNALLTELTTAQRSTS
jgi:hypothetical protein